MASAQSWSRTLARRHYRFTRCKLCCILQGSFLTYPHGFVILSQSKSKSAQDGCARLHVFRDSVSVDEPVPVTACPSHVFGNVMWVAWCANALLGCHSDVCGLPGLISSFHHQQVSICRSESPAFSSMDTGPPVVSLQQARDQVVRD